jgi:hypothetical protein
MLDALLYSALLCFTLLCCLEHVEHVGYAALLCFTLLYSALLCFTLLCCLEHVEHVGYAALLCFTLLYSALLCFTLLWCSQTRFQLPQPLSSAQQRRRLRACFILLDWIR